MFYRSFALDCQTRELFDVFSVLALKTVDSVLFGFVLGLGVLQSHDKAFFVGFGVVLKSVEIMAFQGVLFGKGRVCAAEFIEFGNVFLQGTVDSVFGFGFESDGLTESFLGGLEGI
jgi:hypothetical protein